VAARVLDELRAVLEKTPNAYGWSRHTWTRELLCAEMERRGFERVAVGTMGRALRAIGARLGMAKPIVLCPWPAAKREARLKRLRKLAANASATEPVYYEDEVDIDFNPKIGRDWMLPGTQRLVVTPGQNQKHYVAGALNAKTRNLVWVEHHKKDSSLFCKLVWRLLGQHRRAKCVHLILDNYIIHKSDLTLRVLKSMSHKLRLHFLPPYCPDDNPIERVVQPTAQLRTSFDNALGATNHGIELELRTGVSTEVLRDEHGLALRTSAAGAFTFAMPDAGGTLTATTTGWVTLLSGTVRPSSDLAPVVVVAPELRLAGAEAVGSVSVSKQGSEWVLRFVGDETIEYRIDTSDPDVLGGVVTVYEASSDSYPVSGAGPGYRHPGGALSPPGLLTGTATLVAEEQLPNGVALEYRDDLRMRRTHATPPRVLDRCASIIVFGSRLTAPGFA